MSLVDASFLQVIDLPFPSFQQLDLSITMVLSPVAIIKWLDKSKIDYNQIDVALMTLEAFEN